MKLLALDFGLSKIGTAISDDNQSFVFAREALPNTETVFNKLNQLIAVEKVGMIVMGRSSSLEVRLASEKLAKAIEKKCNMPVVFFTEDNSTQQAKDLVWALGLKKKQRQNFDDDSAAAAYILESYLQSLHS